MTTVAKKKYRLSRRIFVPHKSIELILKQREQIFYEYLSELLCYVLEFSGFKFSETSKPAMESPYPPLNGYG